MFALIRDFRAARESAKAFRELPIGDKKIVFYAEDVHSGMHFLPIIDLLVSHYGQKICYLTSALDDPIFDYDNKKLLPFYVGSGAVRTSLFINLKADFFIMTMPDLDNFHIKRSLVYPVHYSYLFHAMVSTHSNYKQGAFDHFDTIFCTGHYQIKEIRASEKLYGLPEKKLLEIGYPRLDALIEYATSITNAELSDTKKTVIVAPSWGHNAILEYCGAELIERLLDAGYRVIVRPHPMTAKHNPKIILNIKTKYSNHPCFKLEGDVRDKDTLYQADVMISDWSGVAIEYAFSSGKPVLFIDVPQKMNNPEMKKLNIVPVERSWREQLGVVLHPSELEDLADKVDSLILNAKSYREKIEQLRQESVFNLGVSSQASARNIMDISGSIKN
jgi:hypothetical protein